MAASIDTLTIEINASAAKAMPQLDKMISKLNVLTTALKKTSGTSGFKAYQNSVKTFRTSTSKAASSLGTLTSAAGKTSTGMKSLGASLVSVYAKVKALQKSVSGLSNAMLSSMNFIETYHYFDVAMSKIGKDNKDQWAAQGYESADAYAKSFSERALKLNEKMTGFVYDENGYATSNGQKNLGIAPGMVMQYQAQFAQMADSIGMTGEAALATSTAMTMLAGDWSSLKNISFESSFEKMTSALAGQSRAVRSLGIDITQAALQMQLYNLGFDVSISKLSQAQKSELRMIAILEQSKVAYGDLAKTINTPANQTRMLQQNIQSLARTIGNLFLPIIQKVLPYINGFVIALQRAFQWIAGFMGIDIGQLVKSSTSGGTGLEALEDLEDETDDLADAFSDADKEAKKLKRTILGFDELNVLNDPNSGSSSSSNQKVAVGSAIDQTALDQALFDALADYEKVWNAAFDKMESRALTIADNIAAGWGRIVEVIRPTIDAFQRLWNEGLSRLASFTWGTLGDFYHGFLVPVSRWTMGEGLPRFLDALNGFLRNINFEGIRTALSGLYEEMSRFAVNIGEGLIDFYQDMLDLGEGFLNGLPEWIEKLTGALSKVESDKIRKIGYALGLVATAFAAFKLITGVEAIIIGLSGALGALASHPFLALSLGMGALYLALNKYEGLTIDFSAVENEFGNLRKAIKEFSDAVPWEDLRRSVVDLFEAIAKFGVNIGAGIVQFFTDLVGVAGKFVTNVPGMFDRVTDFFNGLDPDLIQKIGYGIGVVGTALLAYNGFTAIASILSGISGAFALLGAHPFAAIAIGLGTTAVALDKFGYIDIDFAFIADGFGKIQDSIGRFVSSVNWEEIVRSLGDLIEAFQPFVKGFADGFTDAFDVIVNDIGAPAINAVASAIRKIATSLKKVDPVKIEAAGNALGLAAAGLLAFKGLSGALMIVQGLGTALAGFAGHPYFAIALGLGSVFLALDKFGIINVDWDELRKGFDGMKNAAVRLKNSIDWEGLASSISGIATSLTPFVEGFGEGFISFMTTLGTVVAEISIPILQGVATFLDGLDEILAQLDPNLIEAVGKALGALLGFKITMNTVTAFGAFLTSAAGISSTITPAVLSTLGAMATKLFGIGAAAYYAHRALEKETSTEDMIYNPSDPKALIDEYSAALYELDDVLGLTDEQTEKLSDALIQMKKDMVAGDATPTAQAISQAFKDAGIEASKLNGYFKEMYPHVANIANAVPTTDEIRQEEELERVRQQQIRSLERIKQNLEGAEKARKALISSWGPLNFDAYDGIKLGREVDDSNIVKLNDSYSKVLNIVKELNVTAGQASDLTRSLWNKDGASIQEVYSALEKQLAELGVDTSQLAYLFKREFPDAVYTAKQSTVDFLSQKFEPVTVSFATNLPEVAGTAAASIGQVKEAYLDLSSYSGQIDSLYSATTNLVQGLALPTETLTHLNNTLLDASLASGATLQSVYDTLVAEMQSMGLETDQLTASFEKAFPNAVRTAKEAVDPLSASAKDAGEKTGGLWDKITNFSLGAALKAVQMKLISSAAKAIGDNSKTSSKNLGTLGDKVSALAETLKSKIKDYASGSQQIGTAIPEGIAQGLADGQGEVMDAATGLAENGIVGAFTDAMDINSPSRVMADLSLMADAGAALGLRDGIGDVAAAAMDVVSAIVDPFRTLGEQIRAAMGDWFYIGRSAAESLGAGLASTYIPVPHLGIESWTQNFLNAEGTAWFNTPNYRIDWYAKGGVFTTPTIAGFGEAGAEAVLPLTNKTSMAMIADAIVGSGGAAFGLTKSDLVDAVETGVAMGLAQNPQTVEVLVNSVLQTSDETMARAVARGQAKLDQRYNRI